MTLLAVPLASMYTNVMAEPFTTTTEMLLVVPFVITNDTLLTDQLELLITDELLIAWLVLEYRKQYRCVPLTIEEVKLLKVLLAYAMHRPLVPFTIARVELIDEPLEFECVRVIVDPLTNAVDILLREKPDFVELFFPFATLEVSEQFKMYELPVEEKRKSTTQIVGEYKLDVNG